MRHRLVVCAAAALIVTAALAQTASSAPGLVVGVDDDAFLWNPEQSAAVARDLGATAFRITLRWDGSADALSEDQAGALDRVVAATTGLRMIVAVFGARAVEAPQTSEQRYAFCSFAGDVLRRYPSIRDIVVWNEANLSYFWQPQFPDGGSMAAPAAYETLLAQCWDTLHAIRPDANVISDISSRGNDNPNAASNISHSPGTFIAGLGAAYRASGRTLPLFDTFGHNPYSQSDELPSRTHPGSTQMSEGDLGSLLAALGSAFAGTGQQVPGACAAPDCPTIWYLEAGYQSVPAPSKASEYTGYETDPTAVADGDGLGAGLTEGSQLRAGLGLAYCQRAVGAFFNFLLADEPGLAGWQSGVLWSDWTQKQAYGAFRDTIASVAAGSISCAQSASTLSPLEVAKRYALVRLHLGRLLRVESVRSRRDPSWLLVDGSYRRPRHSGMFALWLRERSTGWAVAHAARDEAVSRKRTGVPCDVAQAFARAPCS